MTFWMQFCFCCCIFAGIEEAVAVGGIKRRLAEPEAADAAEGSAEADLASSSDAPPRGGIRRRVQEEIGEVAASGTSKPKGPLVERLKKKWAEGK